MPDLPEDDAMSLPNGWVETTLGEVADIIDGDRGKNYPNGQDFSTDGYCLFLNTKNTPNTTFSFSEKMFITKEKDGSLRKGKFKRGDFVLTTRGTIGNYAYFSDDIPYDNIRINSGMVLLRTNVIKGFFYYYLGSNLFKHQVVSLQSGSAQPQLPIKDLKMFVVNLPPLPEQKAIADILSSLDEKIELLREQNKTLETLAQTIFKEWFVNFKAPQPPEGGDGGKSPSGDLGAMVDSELGLIPKGWRVGSLLEVFDLIGGGTPKTSIDEYWNGGIPWYSVVDAPKGSDTFVIDTEKKISALGLEKSSTKLLRKGTTIVSARGTVGKLALVGREAAMNQSCYGIQGKGYFGDYYVYFQIKEALNSLKSRVHGAVFDTITQSTFKNIMVSLPENNLVASFEEKASPIMDKILNNVLQIQSLSIIRDTLLPKLMSGQVRI